MELTEEKMMTQREFHLGNVPGMRVGFILLGLSLGVVFLVT